MQIHIARALAQCQKTIVSIRTYRQNLAKLIHVDTNQRNVVIFGQTGAGKSSILNMLAGEKVATVSGGASGCTSSNQSYPIPHSGKNYTFWDTAGLNESDDGTVSSRHAIQNLLDLVKDNDINLLVYCVRDRLPNIIRVNYDLFWGIVCKKKVPIVLVTTGLEGRTDMESWWGENQKAIKKMKMSFDGHACITSWRGRRNAYDREYEESAKKVWKLVGQYCKHPAWSMPTGWPDQALKDIEAYENDYKAGSGVQKFLQRLLSPRSWRASDHRH